MKLFLFGLIAFIASQSSHVIAQVPPGNMYGRCSNIFGPSYDPSSKAYTASGTCQNGAAVSCWTDPTDGSPDYYCQISGNKQQDPNPSVAADEVCGCMNL